MGAEMQKLSVAAWLAAAITPVVLSGQRAGTTRCDAIQFRFVDERAPATALRRVSPRSGQSYTLSDSIVVDGRGIAEVQVSADVIGTDTTWDVIARLTPAGASALAAATSRNVGHILVVLLDD